jgi:peptidoglycan/xylan/chitin deacetylase (PgdA/CDA1 family)
VSWRRRLSGLLGGGLYAVGLHRPLLGARAVIATFHRIDDRYPGNPITSSVQLFRDLCLFFARHFRVVPLGRLVEMLENGEPVAAHLAITFDDGYLDNHDVAAPMLEKMGLPACFFITTGFIGSSTSSWWDRERGIASEWMSWDQVRSLRARGFEIGAHTISHPDLGQIDGAEAEREIVGSKAGLEAALGGPIVHFAYPYGRGDQLSERNRERIRAAGFHSCVSSYGGTVRPGDDPLRLHRHPVSAWHRSAGQYGLEALREGVLRPDEAGRGTSSRHPNAQTRHQK